MPTREELWEFAEDSLEEGWGVEPASIETTDAGFALDAVGPSDVGGAVMAFRLWAGRFLFATFYYSPDDSAHASDARAFMSSLAPSPD